MSANGDVELKRPCSFFAQGNCKHGESCLYSHEVTPAIENTLHERLDVVPVLNTLSEEKAAEEDRSANVSREELSVRSDKALILLQFI